jgi:hypothetical protein
MRHRLTCAILLLYPRRVREVYGRPCMFRG